MISVEFTVEPNYPETEHLEFAKAIMPWLNYLVENALKIETNRAYDARTHLDMVKYSFYLKDTHETFYRLKYNSN